MALMGSFKNFSGMLKSIATLGINNSIVKLFVENKEDQEELSVVYSTFFWLFLGISTLLCIAVVFMAPMLSNLLFYSNQYTTPLRFFGLLLPLMVINSFWLAIYNGLEKYKSIILIQVISNVVLFATTAYLIVCHNIEGGLLSVALGEFLMVIVTYIFVRKDKSYFQFRLQKILSIKYLKIIQRFSIMALLSAVVVPVTLMVIRDAIVKQFALNEAGLWDAINRLSGFYMMFFSSGLSLYYMPKLASIHTENEFKVELKDYFKILVPLFFVMLLVIYLAKSFVLKLAFTAEFSSINDLLIWQLIGDFFRIMTLAFGFQVLVKTMMKRYFIIELFFNCSYLLLAFYLLPLSGIKGAVQAYCLANILSFLVVLVMFRKLFSRS
jgi:PST family polysaccharide transporter